MIRVRMNHNMRTLVGAELPAPVPLAAPLQALVEAGVRQEKDCFVLAPFAANLTYARNGGLIDATGAECFVNHVHVEQLLPGADRRTLLDQAFAFAQALVPVLQRFGRSASIIVAAPEADSGVSVRFHMNRPAQIWLDPNLESYTGEAIAVLTTSSRRSG